MSEKQQKRYVQSFDRGLAVLTYLNRRNGASIGDVATATGINRGIVYRLLETLRKSGYVTKEPKSAAYWLTNAVRNLADGFNDEDWINAIAKPEIDALGKELVWPISVSTVSGTTMLVRATSDFESPLTMNRFPRGFRFSLASSAAGQVYLACCTAQQRDALLAVMRRVLDDPHDLGVLNSQVLTARLNKIRDQGYASVWGQLNGIGALAVPITAADLTLGAVSLRYFGSALRQDEAVSQFREPLSKCAGAIAQSFMQLRTPKKPRKTARR